MIETGSLVDHGYVEKSEPASSERPHECRRGVGEKRLIRNFQPLRSHCLSEGSFPTGGKPLFEVEQ